MTTSSIKDFHISVLDPKEMCIEKLKMDLTGDKFDKEKKDYVEHVLPLPQLLLPPFFILVCLDSLFMPRRRRRTTRHRQSEEEQRLRWYGR